MTLGIIGAGLPRTGTTSLKEALEALTGEPCYHMFELLQNREAHGPLWARIVGGDLAAADELFAGYGSAIDWPASGYWRELADRYPDARIVLTHRRDARMWWDSATRTVWEAMRRGSGNPQFDAMLVELRRRFGCDDLDDGDANMAAYERYNADVIASVPPERLVVMTPGDGWGPLCRALGLDEPDIEYPRRNTSAEFLDMAGW